MNSWVRAGIALLTAAIIAPDCADDLPDRRPLGASCGAGAACSTGLCFESTCVDPIADEDGDGLINRLELELGTNLAAQDTDGDGKDDYRETGAGRNPAPDFDRDGAIDAVEHATFDSDNDCIPDERDPSSLVDSLDRVAEWACCCSAPCSELAEVVSVEAICVEPESGPPPVLTCIVDGPEDESYPCLAGDGSPCTRNEDCRSGTCREFVCVSLCSDQPDICAPTEFCDGDSCAPRRADGAPCEDASQCQANLCVSGVCGAGCADDADCGSDSYCDGTSCVPRAAPGTSCDRPEQCASGVCSDGRCGGCINAAECDDDSPCTEDACQDALCRYTPVVALCDDGDPCTHDDACDDLGACVGRIVECESDAGDCGLRRACNGTEVCDESYPGLETPCDDGDLCTYADACDGAGGCGGTALVCTGSLDGCLTEQCDGTETCVQTVAVGAGCDDADLCTHTDSCLADGLCAGVALSCVDDPSVCGADRACDGSADCTETFPGAATACDDGDPCTHSDTCDGAGGCAGIPVDCSPGPGDCGVQRACNGTATCTETFPTGSCDDGDACTYDDVCDGAGSCGGTAIVCTNAPGCGEQRSCNGTSTCTTSFPTTGDSCDDGDPCTYDDACDGAGGCVGIPITCNDAPGACGANRACNGTSSCTETFPGATTSCNDGEACTYDDVCDGSGGCSGTSITCNDAAGTCGANRACNGTSTCTVTFPGTGTGCNDGQLCTYNDRCNGSGACVGTSITCNDAAGVCAVNRSCNGTSSCTLTFPGSATTCNDGQLCTYNDRCDGQGVCTGIWKNCNDDPTGCGANRACNGTSSCTVTYPGTNVGCNDQDFCTVGDRCNGAGSCVPTGNAPNGTLCGSISANRCCGGVCRDLRSDPNNCGGCGLSCAPGLACEDLTATPGCGPANTSGRCRCQFSTAQCPNNTNQVGSGGQVCRTFSPWTDRCTPNTNAGCAPGQTDVNLAQCPDYCTY